VPFDARLLSGVSFLSAVAEAGSFVRAAELLNMTASGVSHGVARLEARVGARLFNRTTRALHLTDEGRRLYERVSPLLGEIEAAADEASGATEIVRGRLRVNVDPFFSRLVLAAHLAAFLQENPQLRLELVASDAIGDLVAEGFDLAVRFGDPPPANTLITRKLAETRILTVAAPAYLERRGRPAHPAELRAHACIDFRDPVTGLAFDWEFRRGREVLPVKTSGPLLVSDVDSMLGACVAGAGVAHVMALGTAHLIARGDLVELFPDWPDERFPLYVYYASRNHVSAKVRKFIDFIMESLRPETGAAAKRDRSVSDDTAALSG
jgi:DNA-binding transcriptional LysR family regulator